MTDASSLYKQEYFEYLHNRSKFRKFVRQFYLRDISRNCDGKTIDMGCGIGELLRQLPEGSIGFEINPVAVDFCNETGLKVFNYDPVKDDYRFDMIEPGIYSSFTMNHVLEHLEDSDKQIKKILASCYRLGIKKIVFTVPGKKGFQSDATHMSFIDMKYLKLHGILANEYYHLVKNKYFPFNWTTFSNYFTHNELRLIFERNHD